MNCLTSVWALLELELRGSARRRLANAEDAEDLLQDLYLKALRQGERFCSVTNARAWLFEVARSTLADRLRVHRDTLELPEDLRSPVEETDTANIILTAHLLMPDAYPDAQFFRDAAEQLHNRFEITHTTLQVMRQPLVLDC